MVQLDVNGPDVVPQVPAVLGRHPTQGSQQDPHTGSQAKLPVPCGEMFLPSDLLVKIN